jgi:type 1 fimbria pilin
MREYWLINSKDIRMIKRINTRALLAATLLLTSPLWAADGTMKFSGKLRESTCVLDAESKNMTVPLGNVQRSALKTAGSFSQEVPFTLKFTGCSESTRILSRFMGTASVVDSDVFALDNIGQPGTAKNIGLQILNRKGSVCPPAPTNSGGCYFPVDTPGDTSFPFTARYKALGDNVEPGEANVNIEYSVSYN